MRKLLLAIFTVLVFALQARAQLQTFVPNCAGTNDTTAFSSIITAIGSNQGTIQLPYKASASRCAVNNLTIPANVTLDNNNGSGLKVNTGQTLTLVGTVANPQGKQIFYNVLSGQGTLSLIGNKVVSEMPVEWLGGAGDNSTDNTAVIQAILDSFAAAGKDPIPSFGQGKYVIAGVLRDTLLSNAQIVLPKVATTASMLTVYFKGANPPSTPWNNDSGTILRSTLSSGNGVMIGVKNNQGSGVATATAYMSNASSNIFFAMSNITLQLPINPTNSALDIGHVRNYDLRNNRIVTGDFAQGGANPVVTVGTVVPDLAVTIATTATSYGINLPTNLINNGNIDGLFIAGFYTAIRTGELTKARNIVIHCANVGFQVEGAIWPSIFQNVVVAGTARPIKATGAKSEQAGFPDTVNTSTIYFENMGVENDGLVNSVVYVVDDANNYLSGRLSIFYGAGVDLPLNPAFPPKLVITRSERPWNTREPVTNITGSALTADANKFVINELKSGYAVSNDSGLPWQLYTTNQSGINNGIGVMVWSNEAIPDPLDKRLVQFYVSTDGATNAGKLSIYTMKAGTPGVLNLVATIDQYGNINLATGFLRSGEATLAITSNTIAPTTPVVHVSTTNTLKNITVPPGSAASFTVRLIPDAAWPYDNTGNIVGTGTAVVGRPMDATYTPSTGKFYMSY